MRTALRAWLLKVWDSLDPVVSSPRVGGPRTPSRVTAARLHCRWCGRTTLHLPWRTLRHECEFLADHHATETYQRLAAAMPHADLYPGCICAPGEVTLFAGKPDPFCFALEHRP